MKKTKLIDTFFSGYAWKKEKTAKELEKFFAGLGCNAVGVDFFSSVACRVAPIKKVSPSKIVICGSMSFPSFMIKETWSSREVSALKIGFGNDSVELCGLPVLHESDPTIKGTVIREYDKEVIIEKSFSKPEIGSLFLPAFDKPSARYGKVSAPLATGWVGGLAVCETIKELLGQVRKDLLFNVHGLCYASGQDGLLSALTSINPIVVIHVDSFSSRTAKKKPLVEKLPTTNNVLFSAFKNTGKFDVVVKHSNNILLTSAGRFLYIKVLLPVDRSLDSDCFSTRMVKKVAKALTNLCITTSTLDFRG
jgi:hypothetical protein